MQIENRQGTMTQKDHPYHKGIINKFVGGATNNKIVGWVTRQIGWQHIYLGYH